MNIANIQYNYEIYSLHKIETVLNEITTTSINPGDNIFIALILTDSFIYNEVGKFKISCALNEVPKKTGSDALPNL